MRGRKPQPSAFKLVRGNPGRRPLNLSEPAPVLGHVACPMWLPVEAKRAWREMAPMLAGMAVLTPADKTALVLLCSAYAEWKAARVVVERDGATYVVITEAGSEMARARPEVAIASDAWKRMKAMLVEFGMTPSARSRISVPDHKGGSVWDDL